jgi:hypothetical protein
VPELPLMREFIRAGQQAQRDKGENREAASIIENKASAYGFEVSDKKIVTYPSAVPGFKTVFYEAFLNIFDIVREVYGVDVDYKSLRREWDNWYHMPNSYSEGGFQLICFRKVASILS